MGRQRYFIKFSYHGKNYCGWQRQPNAITVQEVLDKALSLLIRQPIQTLGAGRTDTGVHAKVLYAHFDTDAVITTDLVFRLNGYLPNDITIDAIYPVENTAHARFDAISRTYEYWISPRRSPFLSEFAYYYPYTLDFSRMNKAAEILYQTTHFSAFSKSNTDVKTDICKVTQVQWQETSECHIFTITANRFLRNMVRAIVGSLLEVGKERWQIQDFERIIKTKDRTQAGVSVPPQGLYLTDITYPYKLT